ncbi:hypothetical protein DL93DRAFT_2077419 [Clavulina sp. PMI_390]|nr:hypothetical protein DL93DRAFT_2077419 [Clavulina sp. PMI_390]
MPANEVQTVTLQESGPPTPRPDSPPVVFPPPPPPTLSPRPLYARRSRPVSIWSPQRYSAPQWGPRSSIWAQ